MKGFLVNRKAGWDHGLPVELGVEKMLGITRNIGEKFPWKNLMLPVRGK